MPALQGSPATIRAAQPADAAAIHRLIHESADYEKLSHACAVTPELLRDHLFGQHPAAETLVAELEVAGETRLVGYAIFFTTYSTFVGRPGLYLEDLYVQADYRRRGIGRALLQTVAECATARGCGRLEWSVLDWNAPSIEFYESLGAEPLAEWTIFRLSGNALSAVAKADR